MKIGWWQSIFGGKPVTVKGVLVADDMRSLLGEAEGDIARLDALVVLKHYPNGETKMGLAGDASASDVCALQMLWDCFYIIASGHVDGQLEKEKRP